MPTRAAGGSARARADAAPAHPDAGLRIAEPRDAKPPIADAVIEWYRENRRDLPWRRDGFTPWGTLVSEFMLQQTPVSRVIPRLTEWLERWPTPQALASVPPGEAVRAWQSLGYPRRALWLHACAVAITEQHGGEVPSDVDTLLALPGVGPYTARAVAAFAFGHRHPVVDINVRRVLARALTGHAEPGPPNARTDHALMETVLPTEEPQAAAFNAGMMELGAIVCRARSPRCESCPLSPTCSWRDAGYPEYLGKRAPTQKAFAGSDRQVRGLIMRELRSTHRPVTDDEVIALWADAAQRDRALAGLLADGLAVRAEGGYELP